MSAVVQRLPLGYAREAYLLQRRRGKSVLEALLAASVVDACKHDEMCCDRCRKPISKSSGARVRGRDLFCTTCVLQPTGHEQQEKQR